MNKNKREKKIKALLDKHRAVAQFFMIALLYLCQNFITYIFKYRILFQLMQLNYFINLLLENKFVISLN